MPEEGRRAGHTWENRPLTSVLCVCAQAVAKGLIGGVEACFWSEFIDATNFISRAWPRGDARPLRLAAQDAAAAFHCLLTEVAAACHCRSRRRRRARLGKQGHPRPGGRPRPLPRVALQGGSYSCHPPVERVPHCNCKLTTRSGGGAAKLIARGINAEPLEATSFCEREYVPTYKRPWQ